MGLVGKRDLSSRLTISVQNPKNPSIVILETDDFFVNELGS